MMSDVDYQERRREKRVKTDLITIGVHLLDPQIWFRFWSGTECRMRDISLLGAGVYVRDNLPVGTHLSVDLFLADQKRSPRIFGKVAWISKEENQHRAGISFSWWKDDQDKIRLGNFLKKLTNTTE